MEPPVNSLIETFDRFFSVVDEAGSERLKASLSTVTRLMFEGWSVKTYLRVFDASGAASD